MNIEERDQRLRSQPSQEQSLVMFVNRSFTNVDIVWIDFEGIPKKYATISHKQKFSVKTFVGHPWIFLRSGTKERLPIRTASGQSEVMWPQPYRASTSPQTYRLAIILRPVYSLLRCCFHLLRDSNVTEESIKESGVPAILQCEYQEFLRTLRSD